MTITEKMKEKASECAKIFIKFRIFKGKINKFSLNQFSVIQTFNNIFAVQKFWHDFQIRISQYLCESVYANWMNSPYFFYIIWFD